MEDADQKRDEQQQSRDDISPSSSGRDESQGAELADHAADGESSHSERLISDTGAEELGETVLSKAGKEAVLSSENGVKDWGQGGLQSRSLDLQSTLKLGDAVEDDARAVARSLTALLGSLKLALSKVTGSSLEHIRAENEAAGQVQDVAIDAATKGNRFVNACLRLNEEMKGMNTVATQLETLKQRVDQFEYQANRHLPRQ